MDKFWKCQHGAKCLAPCPGCPGPGVNEPISADFTPRDERKMQASLDTLLRNYETMVTYSRMLASLRRVAYLELLRQGFTDEQALMLCQRCTPLDIVGGGGNG